MDSGNTNSPNNDKQTKPAEVTIKTAPNPLIQLISIGLLFAILCAITTSAIPNIATKLQIKTYIDITHLIISQNQHL